MPLKLKTPRAVLAGKFLSCKACKGQHRYGSSARSRRLAVFAMLRTDVCLQALLTSACGQGAHLWQTHRNTKKAGRLPRLSRAPPRPHLR